MKALPWIAVAGLLLAGAVPVQAASLLEGFESGLGGWIVTPDGGSITTVNSYDGLSATEGSWFAQLTSGDANQWVYMRKAVDIKAGEQVSMDWFFDNAGDSDEATGYVGFYDAFWNEKETLFNLTGSQPTWTTSKATFDQDGTYFIVVGVNNKGDSTTSTLGVDNVYVGPVTEDVREANGSVPEPLTMVGAFMGIGGLAGYIRRHRK